MTGNKETRFYQDKIHMFLGLQRKSKQGIKKCIRQIIKDDEELDLKIIESKLKCFPGDWRIYKTVNARCPEKARKWLLKHLIDHPEKACLTDTLWRTSLLQKDCRAESKFMLDIDTDNEIKMGVIDSILDIYIGLHGLIIYEKIKSPKGWHYITNPFDTREICKLDAITLLRDGYKFIKEIN